MRKRRIARRRRFFGVLRWFAMALLIALLFAFLPVPVGTDASQLDREVVPFIEPTEPQEVKPDGGAIEVVPLVHISTIPAEPDPEAEEPIEAETIPEPIRPKLYTDADAIALAQMGWGEALVTQSDTEIAATMWCALNRYDSGDSYYRNCKTIKSIVEQSGAFAGYSVSNPVDEHLLWLAYDVLDRWNAEKYGDTDVGRVLPAEYMFFHGDGSHNHFRIGFEHTGLYYDWSLESPYNS